VQQPQALHFQGIGEEAHTSDVAARAIETGDEAELHWIGTACEHDGNGCGCRLGHLQTLGLGVGTAWAFARDGAELDLFWRSNWYIFAVPVHRQLGRNL
jgi:hypothetical protein